MEKSNEDKNVAVITTRFVLSGQESITHVYHHQEDGMWEFVGEEDANESDYLVISLEEMVQHDSSIQDVIEIGLGYSAHRVSLGKEWQIKKM